MDPLFGIDEVAVRREYRYLFEHATVVEAMLVALNHMQVDVCYVHGHNQARGHMTTFRKNIISFPQHLTELQQLVHFLSNLKAGDIVNVKRNGDCARAKIMRFVEDKVEVEFSDDAATQVITLQSIEKRVKLPWHPRELHNSHNLPKTPRQDKRVR